MGELPPKLFFRIGEVAGLVGVEPHVLRYWEREFRSIRPTKSAKGQRVYSRKDVENLLRVRDLLYRDGFTIAGAKKKLQRGADGDAAVAPEEVAAIEAEAAAAALSEAALAPEAEPSVIALDGALAGEESDDDPVREKLVALRTEVEDFLLELSRGAARGKPDA